MIQKVKKDNLFYFLIGLAILLRITLMGVFSSDYQNKMFEPFVCDWLQNIPKGNFNPYQNYYDMGKHIDFPYPIVMLLIMSVGGGLTMLFDAAPLFVHNVLFKLPLFVFDMIGFACLLKLFPKNKLMCCLAYLFSPITLYAVYMHGQLDIIPMVLLMLSLYNLADKNDTKSFFLSAVTVGFAILSKVHILAVVPLILIYIIKRYGIKKALQYMFVMIAVTGLGFSVFFGQGFISGVILNTEQSTLFSLAFPYGSLSLYLSLFVLGIIYLSIININIINRDLLFGLCGMIFAVFLALCVPMPGWYVWIVPFVSIFMVSVNMRKDGLICSGFLQIIYLVYFGVFHFKEDIVDLYLLDIPCRFLKLDYPVLKNAAFTLMSACLVYLIFIMYKFGINGNGCYYFRDKSFVIGISGDSGTGKSTMQSILNELLGRDNLLVVEGDGDHKWERGHKNWNEYTHLNPKANYLYRQAMDIYNLKNGQTVSRVDYDHKTGSFTRSSPISPKRFISISGLHTMYLPQLRETLDLKIYMEADEDLRCMWKLERDSKSRGYTKEQVLAQIRSRKDDADKYIVPQREFADIIVEYFLDSEQPVQIGMKMYINTQIDIDEIVSALSTLGVAVSYRFSEDFSYQVAEYFPTKDKTDVQIDFDNIANMIIDHKSDITDCAIKAKNTFEGIQKLIILKAVNDKLVRVE